MSRKHQPGRRFWFEVIGACVTLILLVLSLISKEWIEIVFGVDPDNGSGSLEVALPLVCALATLLLGVLANRDWRRSRQLAEVHR